MSVQCAKCHAIYENRSQGDICGRGGCKGTLFNVYERCLKCPHCGSAYFPDKPPIKVTCAACGHQLPR